MRVAFAACAALLVCGCPDKKADGPAEGAWTAKVSAGKELYAVITTTMGPVTAKLYSKDVPLTVKNFVGLSTGEREWKNPATGELKKGVPLYAGTVFHRVIDGFMIQGGDPLGNGTGDPGYRFADERSSRTFDHVGLLAMANSGPNTNGSQFFITVGTPNWLNGKHTIFGEVVKGYEVVEAISKVQRAPGDKPLTPVVIQKIELFDTQP